MRQSSLLLPLQGSPRFLGRRPGGLAYPGPSVHVLAGLLLEWKRQQDVQNPHGSWPGGNVSHRSSSVCGRAKCTLRAPVLPGEGNSPGSGRRADGPWALAALAAPWGLLQAFN
jgi:hypothetical protein